VEPVADSRQAAADRAVRLDRWLWAARFYKTRAAASQAIDGGKVDVNDVRAKRAKPVRVGDGVRVRRGPFEFRLTVKGLSEHRGGVAAAATLYEEDAAAKLRRERLAHQLRVAPPPLYEGKGRPTKRDRREMERLRGDDL
jgi:ribosome-associated heat shock protein Hsp15